MTETPVSQSDARTNNRAKGRALRVVVWGVLLALLVPVFTGLFGAAAASADDDRDALNGVSFYELSAELTNMFSSVQDPSTDVGLWGDTIRQNPGSAGSFLGYQDVNFLDNPARWATAQVSGSSDALGYDSLTIYKDNKSGGGAAEPHSRDSQGFQNYAYYGAALNSLGLDGTGIGLGVDFVAMFGGAAMWLVYHLVYVVDVIMWALLSVLGWVNPFRLFYLGMYAISPELADGMTGGQGETSIPGLSGLLNWIGGWYQALVSLSWGVMVPLFIAVFIFGLLAFKKGGQGGDRNTAIRKLVIRLFFIGFGLPLFGSMYSATLDTLSDGIGTGNRGASQVVLSTYVDFEPWIKQERLALPAGAVVEWDPDRSRPGGNAERCLRNTTLLINSMVHDLNMSSLTTACGTDGDSDADHWSGALSFTDDTQGLLSDYDRSGQRGTQDRAFADDAGAPVVRDLLVRYMSGSLISAADFETDIKSRMVAAANSGRNGVGLTPDDNAHASIVGWFGEIEDLEGPRDHRVASNPLISISWLRERGGLQAKEASDGVVSFNSDAVTPNACENFDVWSQYENRTPDDGVHAREVIPVPMPCNMSPLATYNYLTTSFNSSSLLVYSSNNVMSGATMEQHRSVNLVGHGVMKFLYWLNSIILLMAFVTLGVGYAFSMFFGAIKRGFQLITAIPFATLGALAGIAKVIIYSMALVLELLITVFVYLLVQEMLLSLPQIIEAPIAVAVRGMDPLGVTAVIGGPVFAMINICLACIGTLLFVIMAFKLRKSVLKASDEAVTRLVEKFLATNAVPASAGGGLGGSLGQAMGSGIGAGVGAGAANKLMTGLGPKGGKGGNVGGTSVDDGIGTEKVSKAVDGPTGGKGGVGPLPGMGGGAGGTGGSDGPQGPDDKDPNGSGGSGDDLIDAEWSPSSDQKLGEKVLQTGLSMDGKGHGSTDTESPKLLELPKSGPSGSTAGLPDAADLARKGTDQARDAADSTTAELTSQTRELSRTIADEAGSVVDGGQDSSTWVSEAGQEDGPADGQSGATGTTGESSRETASVDSVVNPHERSNATGNELTGDSSSQTAFSTRENAAQRQNDLNADTIAVTSSGDQSVTSTQLGGENPAATAADQLKSEVGDVAQSASQETKELSNATRNELTGDSSSHTASSTTHSGTEQQQGPKADPSAASDSGDQSGAPSAADQLETAPQKAMQKISNATTINGEGDLNNALQDNSGDTKNFDEQRVAQENHEARDANKEVGKQVAADAIKGGVHGAVEGVAGGPTGMAAGTARGAAVEGGKSAANEVTKKAAESNQSRDGERSGSSDSASPTVKQKAETATKEVAKDTAKASLKGGVKGAVKGIGGGPTGMAAGAASGAATEGGQAAAASARQQARSAAQAHGKAPATPPKSSGGGLRPGPAARRAAQSRPPSTATGGGATPATQSPSQPSITAPNPGRGAGGQPPTKLQPPQPANSTQGPQSKPSPGGGQSFKQPEKPTPAPHPEPSQQPVQRIRPVTPRPPRKPTPGGSTGSGK